VTGSMRGIESVLFEYGLLCIVCQLGFQAGALSELALKRFTSNHGAFKRRRGRDVMCCEFFSTIVLIRIQNSFYEQTYGR
jgi:hypothetical protein